MAEPNATPNRTLMAIGLLVAAAGIYFGLVGFAVLPPPSPVNGPLWLSFFIGVVLFAAGLALLVRGVLGGDENSGELPGNAPKWAAIIYWLTGLLMASGLAGLGTWVAFGGGTRHFTFAGPIAGTAGEGIGRTVFGIGAIITWLLVAVMARAGAKKIFGKKT